LLPRNLLLMLDLGLFEFPAVAFPHLLLVLLVERLVLLLGSLFVHSQLLWHKDALMHE
jgi:hypothetical protein